MKFVFEINLKQHRFIAAYIDTMIVFSKFSNEFSECLQNDSCIHYSLLKYHT